jgi:hypothetical protein
MSYVTVAIVDALLGPGWALTGAKPRAVMMANAWLTERIKRTVETPVPAAILQAGAEVARDAGADLLYKAEAREVSATTVSAGGGVSVAKSFTPGAKAMTAGETLATALIKPWTRRPSSITLLRV